MRTLTLCAVILAVSLFFPAISPGQSPASLAWSDPAASPFFAIGGRSWQSPVASPYDRLPAKAESLVRREVWNLSRHSAGLYIGFRTNAENIEVRYQVAGSVAMNHMPATGVSGLDLYARDAAGNWHWAPGRFEFGDTIRYRFHQLRLPGKMVEFRLYLPLYNAVKWLQVGLPEGAALLAPEPAKDRPVLVYGTSIAQGGCASRPGLAWTNILARRLGRDVINLGFSGNGRLEEPVLDLMTETDAALYVLDCMPNMGPAAGKAGEETRQKIMKAVEKLQLKRPGIPILLTEHSGGAAEFFMDHTREQAFLAASKLVKETYGQLRAKGVKGIFLLASKEIKLSQDGTVDGVHPNDIGMMEHAAAYETRIRAILK